MQQTKSIQIPSKNPRAAAQAWINWGVKKFQAHGVEAPQKTAVELLAHANCQPKAKVLSNLHEPLSLAASRRFQKLVLARCRRIPLQYLLGSEYFGGLTFKVGPGVLIPRPETELILEEARSRMQTLPRLIVDLGTGSGNLVLALAREYPQARLCGLERSSRALAWARANLGSQRLAGQVRLIQGANAQSLPRAWQGCCDLAVSNPPYIPSADLAGLQPEVRHEPRLALDGGPDGLRLIRRMLATAARLLRPGGLFACEIGVSQRLAVEKLFVNAGFSDLHCRQDWQGIPRVLSGLKRS